MPKNSEERDQEEVSEDGPDEEKETQKDIMREWFYENYEDPANCTPYESAEGGYQYIWGGPYEADDVLFGEFGNQYPENVIEELAEELSGECWAWAPTLRSVAYDEEMFDEISGVNNYYSKFHISIEQVRSLITGVVETTYAELMSKLLFANVITIFETLLSDAFIYNYAKNSVYLERFVESTDKYQQEKIRLADIFKESKKIATRVKTELINTVWHRLDRVEPYYKNTFGVTFNVELKDAVFKAVEIRHDIVHRNGKDKEGKPTQITMDDLILLLDTVERFARDIENQLANLSNDMPSENVTPF